MLVKIFISANKIDFAENTGCGGRPKRRYQAEYF
jgi:hypothetical protein